MRSIKLSILISVVTSLCIGCTGISRQKTTLTVGKVHTKSYAGKNGATHFSYYLNGIKYVSNSAFDRTEFADGDMFLVYVDKADPNKTYMPFPEVKILPMNEGDDSICMTNLGINFHDFRLISSYMPQLP